MANFSTPYQNEREGQMEFFDNFGIPYDEDNSILVDDTDGIYNGNIFEFKLTISNLNKTLFQAIKYLSKRRIKAEYNHKHPTICRNRIAVKLLATLALLY